MPAPSSKLSNLANQLHCLLPCCSPTLAQAALAAQLPPDSLVLGAPVASVEATQAGAAVILESGQRLECLAVVGADGARSAVTAAAGRGAPNYCGQSAVRCAVYGVLSFYELPGSTNGGMLHSSWVELHAQAGDA